MILKIHDVQYLIILSDVANNVFQNLGAYCTCKTIVIHIYILYLLRLLKAADSSDIAGFRLIKISILSVWKTKLFFTKLRLI